mmetsp:Transcript_57273/g.131265  ORF Transcript_57273/g.131265 Transcript_57273/m.131265 type:complete len:347 (+) Transcript_57273:331-1371(+)
MMRTCRRLAAGVAGPAREGDHVADVVDAGGEEDEALKAEAEARVHARPVLAQVRVPLVLNRVDADFLHPLHKHIIALLALRSADELSDARDKHVHRGYRLAVLVSAHVERLDGLGVVVADHRLLEHHLAEVALMFGAEVHPPRDIHVHKHLALRDRLEEDLDGLGVRAASEGLGDDRLRPGDALRIVHLGEHGEVIHALLEHALAAEPDVVFGALHVVVEVRERDLRLDHPELRKVPGGMGVLRAEGRPERVHRGHRARVDLRLQLARDGHGDRLPEKVLGIVDGPIRQAPDPAHLRGRSLGLLDLGLARLEFVEGGFEVLLRLGLRRLVLLLARLLDVGDSTPLR